MTDHMLAVSSTYFSRKLLIVAGCDHKTTKSYAVLMLLVCKLSSIAREGEEGNANTTDSLTSASWTRDRYIALSGPGLEDAIGHEIF